MTKYHHPAMKELAVQQVNYSPPERRTEQTARAEALMRDIEPTREYPYQFVCFRLTNYRPETHMEMMLPGKELHHDLRSFIEDLSESVDLFPESVPEPVLTVDDVAKEYSISTKTVSRWRERGLVSRRFVIGGRKRVAFLRSSLDYFVNTHAEEVMRGARFTQLTEEERQTILRRARRMLQAPTATVAEVSRRLARRMNRSQETIRYTIRNFEKEHPEQMIATSTRAPLNEQERIEIYNSHRRGFSVEQMAAKFRRTRGSIHRVIQEVRAERLLRQPIEYVPHASFDEPAARREIELGVEPAPAKASPPKPPAGLPAYLQSLYEVPLLTREQEQFLFRKMNFLLHRAKLACDAVDLNRVRASQLDDIERLLADADAIRGRLIRANLRLVVSIAKKHADPSHNLFDLISDGNVSLMRAVAKFDYSRGFKFSTYASWAIIKNFARSIPAENTQRDRYMTGQDLAFEMAADSRSIEFDCERDQESKVSTVANMLEELDDRERQIIVDRFGLDGAGKPRTLEQVGERFGITKERVRQIESRALAKMKAMAVKKKLDTVILD